jgi:hypothetical protein
MGQCVLVYDRIQRRYLAQGNEIDVRGAVYPRGPELSYGNTNVRWPNTSAPSVP